MLAGLRPIWISSKEILLPALVSMVFFFRAYGQQEIKFSSLNTRDGLSSNTINAILKDRYGLMWFATDDGLDRFDGSSFTVYRNKPGDAGSLQANEILALHEDRQGNLWIGTSGGSLSLYDRRQDRFINYPSGRQPGSINNNVIMSICSDAQGRIWIASFNGVNILDPVTNSIERLDGPEGLPFSKICLCIVEDGQHDIWIGTTEGLFRYQPLTREFRHYMNDPANPASLAGNTIAAIAQDKKGNVWVGSQEGLSRLNKDGNTFTHFRHSAANPFSISSNLVHSIACSASGELWIGTEKGLNIYDNSNNGFKRLHQDYRDIHGLSGQVIRVVYMDGEGIYWLGTTRGGVNKYDRNLHLFSLVLGNPFDQQGLNASVVNSFAESSKGFIFIGTEGAGLRRFDPVTKLFSPVELRSKRKNTENGLVILSLAKAGRNELLAGSSGDGLFILNTANGHYRQLVKGPAPGDLNSNDIYCITVDSKRNRWLGTNGNGINVLDSNNKLIYRLTPAPLTAVDKLLPLNGFIRDIAEDRDGMIWIATHGGGIAQYNPLTGVFTVYTTVNSQLPNDKVQTILVDRTGNIWTGTFGGGLGLFDRSRRQFITYTEKDGLQNNTVYKILEDGNGLLWISTNKGLSSLDPANKKFSNYNFHHGLQHNNFSRGAGLHAGNGLVFFGGSEGFNYFQPDFLKKNPVIPTVLLTDLKVANQPVSPSKNGILRENISVAGEINLSYRQNFVISYIALDYTVPGQNQYAYKLDGFDKVWNRVGNTTSASYTNLDPGEYIFHVKAGNNDGIWSDRETSVKIIVRPPFWRTIYAYLLYFMLTAGTALYSRHKGIEKIKRKLRAEQEKREADRVHETDQLKIKFLTNLSHEFRTPISLILGPVEKLLTAEKNTWQAEHLQMIKRNGKRLLNLVNQLLDFRKMEEQELRLQETTGDLIAFTKDIFDSFKDLAERRHINYSFYNNIKVFNTVFDHGKMERIFFNLLSNAFKFTPEWGNVCLSAEIQPASAFTEQRRWMLFKIADSGMGIHADKKEKIFERFFQQPGGSSILNQGTGIGLSIAREFVNMHGGKIEVESEPAKGAVFSIQIPFTVLENSFSAPVQPAIALQPEETSTANAAALPIHEVNEFPASAAQLPPVLLVEDNDDFRHYLKESLQPHFKVFEATNGKDGWQTALARHPQLIVSDISMPCMDGIELCKKLKADKRTNHIPVILLTALTGDEAQLEGLQTGANDYITKPFNAAVLLSKIKNLLSLKDTFKNNYSRKIDLSLQEPAVQPEGEKLICSVVRYIEDNLTDSQVSVETLSRHLGMSRSSLYNRLFDITGQTPVEYIRSVKLEKAAVLLEKSDMNIAQVAYSAGFATPNYFAKSFKNKYNMLPSEYILKMRRQTVITKDETSNP